MTGTNSCVHIVDDDDAVRDSLAFVLGSAGYEVKAHASPRAFLEQAGAGGIACLVTDVRMPEMNGIELLERMRRDMPEVPVIVVTGHGDIPLAVDAMRKGALDFLEKPFDDEALICAVRLALGRQREKDRLSAERATIRDRLATISARERQVLDGLVAGKANKVIAQDLAISPRTVEVYRANVMTKMQANSLSDLVRMSLLAEGLGSGATAS